MALKPFRRSAEPPFIRIRDETELRLVRLGSVQRLHGRPATWMPGAGKQEDSASENGQKMIRVDQKTFHVHDV
jgi:hypothetical protein